MPTESNVQKRVAEEGQKVMEAARAFVHEPEVWESYESMKESISAALPVEFMALCESVERYFGPPKGE